MQRSLVCFLFLFFGQGAFSKPLQTNAVTIDDAPDWLAEARVHKVARRVEDLLEWDIRRVQVQWHTDAKAFRRAHGLGPEAIAATDRKASRIHIGPMVTHKNFDAIFAHELAHIIVIQKYKQAIPAWLEEGLANYVGGIDNVDYAFLRSKPKVAVRELTHPYKKDADTRYHYQASTALMKMIAQKCPMRDLLQLSVGKSIETYLKTFCGIPDLDKAFHSWLATQSAK